MFMSFIIKGRERGRDLFSKIIEDVPIETNLPLFVIQNVKRRIFFFKLKPGVDLFWGIEE